MASTIVRLQKLRRKNFLIKISFQSSYHRTSRSYEFQTKLFRKQPRSFFILRDYGKSDWLKAPSNKYDIRKLWFKTFDNIINWNPYEWNVTGSSISKLVLEKVYLTDDTALTNVRVYSAISFVGLSYQSSCNRLLFRSSSFVQFKLPDWLRINQVRQSTFRKFKVNFWVEWACCLGLQGFNGWVFKIKVIESIKLV